MTKEKANQIVELIIKGMPGEIVLVTDSTHGTIQSQDILDRDVNIVNGSDRKLKAGSYPRSHFVPTLFAYYEGSLEGLTYVGQRNFVRI